jgi:branched-chain amino acid transport system permease protein
LPTYEGRLGSALSMRLASSAPLARLRRLEYRNETALLAGMVLFALSLGWFSRTGVPVGVWGLGTVSGSSLALEAMGLVLVYRSNRIINFAQVQVGATAAALFSLSVNYIPLARVVHDVCPPCMERISRTDYDVNYWLSMVLAVALALLISLLMYIVVVRRFARAPRLVLTVATIFVAEALPDLVALGGRLFSTPQQRVGGVIAAGPAPLPFDFPFDIGPVRFHAADVFTVGMALIAAVGVTLYLRFSATGTAIRAASEHADRATTLGVNVTKVTSRVWLIVGLLSVVAGLLTTITSGSSADSGPQFLLEMLTVAVIARLSSLPVAAIASLILGVVQQAMLWVFSSETPFYGGLVLLIALALLLQRRTVSRAELEQASAWGAARELRPVPRELRRVPSVVTNRRWMIGVGVAIVLAFPWPMKTSQIEIGTTALIYIMVGLSILVLTGWGGQISLGQFAFAGIAAYFAAISQLPFFLAVPLGAIVGAVAAFLVGIPALKLRGLQLAVITLALAVSVSSVLLDPSYLGKHLPSRLGLPTIAGVSLDSPRVYYYLVVIILALVTVGVMGLRRSRTARALIAARDNDRAAASFGIEITRARLVAFAVSGLLSGLAGGLFAYQQHAVTALDFQPQQSINVFLYTVVGGLGSIAGPFIGNVLLGGLLASVASWMNILFTGVGGLLILLFWPGGLAEVFFGVRDAALRRIAARQRIVVPSLFSDRDPMRMDGRFPFTPKRTSRGTSVFVPSRYTLHRQWALRMADSIVLPGTIGRSADAEEPTLAEVGAFHGMSEDEGDSAHG